MSYFTGIPTNPPKSAIGACCSGCATGATSCGEADATTNVVGIAAIIGIGFLAIRAMKKAGRAR